jgi:8-oxo-dGTP pyrophosphatase MutT (NUDIX family)
MSTPNNQVIKAAGGLLWRHSSDGYEIAIVHRRRYDDWTLPKGKLQDGESWREAALREVKEETGYDGNILSFAGAIAYETDDKPKVVRFWHMTARGEPASDIDDEVAEVFWLPHKVAHARLQYPLEQALVDVCQAPSSPSFFLVMWFRTIKRRWLKLFRPVSLQRLESTIQIFEPELEALIEDQNIKRGDKLPLGWDKRSTQLLEKAKKALDDFDAELGWRCWKAADRFRLYGLGTEDLKTQARIILNEGSDEEKGLTKWRGKSIQELLAHQAGKLKEQLNPGDVTRAKRILDEHQDNVYHKYIILKSRLRLLTVISWIAIGTWIWWPPLSPVVKSATAVANLTGEAPLVPARRLWLAVILSGVLGATFSGFSSSIALDQKKNRIPDVLSTSTLTFARFSIAMVSAIVISIFLLSGVLNLPKPTSLELLLAVAFAAGFSDRLLLRAIESVSK